MTDVSAPSSASEIFVERKGHPTGTSSFKAAIPRYYPQQSTNHEMVSGQVRPSTGAPGVEQARAQIRQRSVQQSESRKHLIHESPGSYSRKLQHMGTFQGATPGSAIPVKSPYICKGETVEFSCPCRPESERWQQGPWSGEDWESERFTSKKAGVCKCLAGAAADCTAVCCCPLSLLHLLALACIKLPSIVVMRTLRKVKAKLRKKKKCKEVDEDDGCPTTPFTPSVSWRESMEDGDPWTPTAGFADNRMWQEYFGADATVSAPH